MIECVCTVPVGPTSPHTPGPVGTLPCPSLAWTNEYDRYGCRCALQRPRALTVTDRYMTCLGVVQGGSLYTYRLGTMPNVPADSGFSNLFVDGEC